MLSLTIPAVVYSGVYNAIIDTANPSLLYFSQPGQFNVTIGPAHPSIVLLSPSSAKDQGGTTVTVYVRGFPKKMLGSSVTVSFGTLAAQLLGSPAADDTGVGILAVRIPAGAGLSEVVVAYRLPDSGLPSQQLDARQHFLYLSSEVTAQCVGPCWCDVALQLQPKVAFLVSAAGTARWLQDLVVGCSVQLDGRPASNESDCFVAEFTSEPFPCDAAAGANRTCARVTVHISLIPSAPQLAVGPSIQGFVTLASRSSNNARLQVAVPILFRRAPRLLSAIFSSSFGRVVLTWDQATNTPPLPCSMLLRHDVLGQLLGAEPGCGWSSQMNLIVTLGFGATIMPGDILALAIGLSDSAGELVPALNQSAVVAAPQIPLLPSVSFTGPDTVSKCDAAKLTAVASTAPGATFVWGCENDNGLDALIANQTVGPTVKIQGYQLAAGKSYFISVRARSRFGIVSSPAFRTLMRTESAQPLVTIKMPAPPYLRSSTMYLEAEGLASACPSAPSKSALEFSWTITAIAVKGVQSPPTLQDSGPMLVILAGALATGWEYVVTLVGIQAGQSPAKTTQGFALSSQPVVARIAGGGSRALFVRGSTVVDASPSYDPDSCSYAADGAAGVQTCISTAAPDASGSLAYAWACSVNGLPCMLAVDGSTVSFGTTALAVLDMASIALPSPAPSELVMTVSVSRGKENSDVARASVVVLISQTPTMDVQIRPLYETAERAAYAAVIPTVVEESTAYAWSLIGGSNNGSTLFSMKDTSTFLAGNTGTTFVVRLDSAAAAVLLYAPGAAYTVSLDVTTGSSWGRASLALLVPQPPSGGACAGQPTSGVALVTAFAVRCWDWVADRLPITYSFAARPPAVIDPADASVSWSVQTPSPAYELYLPAGNYSFAARIFDVLGTSSTVIAATVVVSASGSGGGRDGGAGIDLTGLQGLTDRLLGQGSTGTALALFDGVGASLNVVSIAPNAGSRRLAGSSAAYRAAVRRMLLRRLSGVGPVITLTSTAVIRAARRAAAVPAEVDAPSASAAVGQLVAALGAMDLRRVRSAATLPDAAGLVGHILAAAVPRQTGEELAALGAEAAAALLSAAQLYAAGMMATEAAMTVHASENVLLEMVPFGPAASGLSVSVTWPPAVKGLDSVLGSRALESAAAVAPVGMAVLRLGTSLGSPTAPFRDVNLAAAEIVGVRMASSSTSSTPAAKKSAMAWACPGEEGVGSASTVLRMCVDFNVAMRWAPGAEKNTKSASLLYSCQRWDGNAWAGGNCITIINESKAHCTCNSDGVFTVAAVLMSNEFDKSSPDCMLRSFNTVELGATVTCDLLSGLLAAFTFLVLGLTSRWIDRADQAKEQPFSLPSKQKELLDPEDSDDPDYFAWLTESGIAWLADSDIAGCDDLYADPAIDDDEDCSGEESGYATWFRPTVVSSMKRSESAKISATAMAHERPWMVSAVDREENGNPSEYCQLNSPPQLEPEDALLPLLLRTTALGQSRGVASHTSQRLRQALGTTAASGGHVLVSASFVLEPQPSESAATSTPNLLSAGTRCPAYLQSSCPAQGRLARSAYAESAAHNPGQDSGHFPNFPYEQDNDIFCVGLDQANQAPVDALLLERIMSVSDIILGDNSLGCSVESNSPSWRAQIGEVGTQPCSWTLHRPPCPPPSSPVLSAHNPDQGPVDTLWLERVMSVSAIILGDDTLDGATSSASSDLDV
jgi:hypothetical protein